MSGMGVASKTTWLKFLALPAIVWLIMDSLSQNYNQRQGKNWRNKMNFKKFNLNCYPDSSNLPAFLSMTLPAHYLMFI